MSNVIYRYLVEKSIGHFRNTAGQTRQQAFFLKQAPDIIVGYLSVFLNMLAFGQSPFQSPQRVPFGSDKVGSPAPCDKEYKGGKHINEMGQYGFYYQTAGHVLNVDPLQVAMAVINRDR